MNQKHTPCRQVRRALGLTQREFSEQLQVAKQTIVDIEGRRGVYESRIPRGLARRMAVISGAHPHSLISQDGKAWSSESVDGRYEVYSERHAALWKAAAQDRNFSEDGPNPLIGKAVWTVASALVAADEQGPLRAAVLWDNFQSVIDNQRQKGFALGSGMARHTTQRAKLGQGIPADGLNELHPLTLMKLANQDDGERLLTLSLITRTAAQLASPEKSPKEIEALKDAAELLRKRGLALLKETPSQPPSVNQAKKPTKLARRKPNTKTIAPKRRR